MTRKTSKLLVTLFILLGCQQSFAQKTVDHFYDYNWRLCAADEARFYSMAEHTDSGWHRNDIYVNLKKLQMAGLYEDKEGTMRNGTFHWFYTDGVLKSVGKYVHNNKEGLWLDYYQDASLKDSLNYKDGHLSGISLSWYLNGMIRDSSSIDENGNGVYFSWFDNGSPSSAGKYIDFEKRQGKWQYFHKNGQLSALETYDHDSLIDKKYFSDDGTSIDTTSNDREVKFEGGSKAWSKYLSKNLYFPSGYEFKNGYQAVVVVSATIDEDGKVVDVVLEVPLHKEFNKIAIDALKDSPAWSPAILHNRKVYSSFTQAINFSQTYN